MYDIGCCPWCPNFCAAHLSDLVNLWEQTSPYRVAVKQWSGEISNKYPYKDSVIVLQNPFRPVLPYGLNLCHSTEHIGYVVLACFPLCSLCYWSKSLMQIETLFLQCFVLRKIVCAFRPRGITCCKFCKKHQQLLALLVVKPFSENK